jgi:hypothetical protein
MATLKVNLTQPGNATAQDQTPAGAFPSGGMYLNLLNLDGTPFIHAGKEYAGIPMDHGYAEVKDVPEGKYLLYAMVNPFQIGPILFQSNYVSHYAYVTVCCGCKDYCITLYNPNWHYCVTIIIHWFKMLVANKEMKGEVADNVINSLNEAMKSAGNLNSSETDMQIIKLIEKHTETFLKVTSK